MSPWNAWGVPRSDQTPSWFPRRCGDVPHAGFRQKASLRGVGSPAGAGMSPGRSSIPLNRHGSPAGAGMSPPAASGDWFPRRCGDVEIGPVPPQVRGCPVTDVPSGRVVQQGSPAGAGMSRSAPVPPQVRGCMNPLPSGRFPRRCGDVPPAAMLAVSGPGAVPPQVRGCPAGNPGDLGSPGGSPAGAGMFPSKRHLITVVDTFYLPPHKGPGRPKTKKPSRKPSGKPTVSKPRKKARPKGQKSNPRTPMTTAQVEDQQEERREYDRQRSQNPERKEAHRLQERERRRKAKELGLCRECSNPAKPGETRCEPCAEKHRVGRRRSEERAAQQRDQASGQASFA